MSSRHPPLRPFARGVVPVPTGAQSADFDRHAIDEVGVPQPVLMENAGRSAAQVAARLFPEGPVVGLIGSGNNGGDGLVLLRTLKAWGREVAAILVADRPQDDPLLHGWDVPMHVDGDLDAAAWSRLLDGAGLVVDAVLGTGVRGAPRERQAAALARAREADRPTLAIDIPSGVDGATGAVPGTVASADVTVAFGAPKMGSLLHPGRAHTGRLVVVEIAFPPLEAAPAAGRLVTPEWARVRLPGRGTDTHKNAVGRLVVVAGSPGMAGAAVLATRAGLRAGAGLVQVCSPPGNREILQSAVPEAIYVDASDEAAVEEALGEADAVAAGPGLGTGETAEALLGRVLDTGEASLVLDADALNLVAAGRTRPLAEVSEGRPLLLTPHPGEMSRLLDRSSDEIAADRPSAVRDAADRFGCAVLLKGAPSLTATPGAPVLVDSQGSSDLAVAGMGDVLTGVCGSLLAQGVGPREAGALGLFLSGRAGTVAGRGASLVPGDVVRWLSEVLEVQGDGDTDLDLPFVVLDMDPAH